eukprot:160575-Pelagomonas_calceolata.AAC.1
MAAVCCHERAPPCALYRLAFGSTFYSCTFLLAQACNLGKHALRNIARFCSHARTLRVETSLWQEHTSAAPALLMETRK